MTRFKEAQLEYVTRGYGGNLAELRPGTPILGDRGFFYDSRGLILDAWRTDEPAGEDEDWGFLCAMWNGRRWLNERCFLKHIWTDIEQGELTEWVVPVPSSTRTETEGFLDAFVAASETLADYPTHLSADRTQDFLSILASRFGQSGLLSRPMLDWSQDGGRYDVLEVRSRAEQHLRLLVQCRVLNDSIRVDPIRSVVTSSTGIVATLWRYEQGLFKAGRGCRWAVAQQSVDELTRVIQDQTSWAVEGPKKLSMWIESNDAAEQVHTERTRCVLDASVYDCANDLCAFESLSEEERHSVTNNYHLHCLALFAEACLLYDTVIVFNYYPDFFETWRHEDTLASQLNYRDPGSVTFVNAHTGWQSRSDPTEMNGFYMRSVKMNDGTLLMGEMLSCPEQVLETARGQLSGNASLIRESTRSFGLDLLSFLPPEEREKFSYLYSANRIWNIEAARQAVQISSAGGYIPAPTAAPFWKLEHQSVETALHSKFDAFQRELARRHLVTESLTIDLSPVVLLVLDGAYSPGLIAETIADLRRDYAALRALASSYQEGLRAAETYGEAADVTKDWERGWASVVHEMGPRQGLLRKLVSWDVLKKGSLRYALMNSAEEVGRHLTEIEIVKGLNILHTFEEEFLFARIAGARLTELFGRAKFGEGFPWGRPQRAFNSLMRFG